MKFITRTVWILSLVSCFTDIATEMLYPVMPIYLKSIGFSIVLIGILEGLVEASAGLSKAYFGKLSDNSGKRVPFVQLGYAMSAVAKPLIVLFVSPIWVFLMRTVERFGKGIRTGARDALLSDEATIETKAKVFGFHRAMDTFGAVLGPVFALIYLHFYPEDYKTIFFIAFIPGLLALLASFYLKEKTREVPAVQHKPSVFSFFGYWKMSPSQYKRVLYGLIVFAMFNSSDVFLLLKAKESGLSDTAIIGVYIFYNLIYALCAFPLGVLADRIGLKRMYIMGLTLFVFVYAGMSFSFNTYVFMLLMFMYGVYAAATEGISKAWISNVVDKKDLATALGTYSGFQSLASLCASVIAGVLWFYFGASVTFIVTAIVGVCVVVYFSLFHNDISGKLPEHSH